MQRRFAIAFVLAMALAVVPAGASTFLAMSEDQLVAESTAVVEGTVVSVDSFWNDSHTVIITEAVLDVEKSVVGQAPRFVTVRTAGGTVGDYTIVAHGFPTFREGERAVLFLGKSGFLGSTGDALHVTGYQLGHYRILTNSQGVDVAIPTLDPNVRLLSANGEAVAVPRARPLAAFEASLQETGRRILQRSEGLR